MNGHLTSWVRTSLLIVFIAGCGIAGCGGDGKSLLPNSAASAGGGGGGGGGGGTNSLQITGNVVDAPLVGATVNLYLLNADGSKGALLGTTTTDGSGAFSVTLSPSPASPVLAEATGGSYIDEVTEQPVTLSPSDSLTAVLPPGTKRATITPLTHMAAERARALAEAGTPLETAVSSSNIGVAAQFGLQDIIGTIPGSARDSAQMQTADREQRRYSLVLAGIAQEADSLNVRAIDLAAALAADMKDGILDGKNGSTAITMPRISGGSVTLTAAMGTTDLQVAIDTFTATEVNQTNLTTVDITTTPVQVGVNTAGALYTTTTVLPAWVSGQSGSAALTATGGTPPYTCSLTGSLPTGFSLSPSNCVLFGTASILGGGTTMSISAPFTVTITDSAGAMVNLELRITTVLPPPTLVPVAGSMTVNVSGSTLVATATGGTPPYYFVSDTFRNGAPPLGTVVGTGGLLSGTPSRAGTFGFGVCVVDSVGAKDCRATSVTVAEEDSPFEGSISGSWSGTCEVEGNVSNVGGSLTMYIGSSGAITGSYSGDHSGVITGSVNLNGGFSASGGGTGAGWSGNFSVNGTTITGSGSWGNEYCSGSWSAAGAVY